MIVSLDTQPTTVTVGERFTLTAEVRNISSQNLQQVVAAVTFDPSLVQLRGPADKHLGSVNNRRTKTAEWRFEALAVGSVVLTVRVTAFDQEGGGAIEEEKTAIIEIIGGTARRDSEDDDEGEEDEEDDERGERDVGGTGDDESGAPRSDSDDESNEDHARGEDESSGQPPLPPGFPDLPTPPAVLTSDRRPTTQPSPRHR